MKKLKIIKDLEKMGCKILGSDIISDKHLDSFWYDGSVLNLDYFGELINVYACGEIRIFNKYGYLVYDCKERNEGFNFELKEDKDLKKIEKSGCYFDENNWFEIGTEEDIADGSSETLNSLAEVKEYLKGMEFKDKLKAIVWEKANEKNKNK